MSNHRDDPRESTVREALAAIQRHGSDVDMNARLHTPRHRAWLLRIDAIEAVLQRVVLRNAQAEYGGGKTMTVRREVACG